MNLRSDITVFPDGVTIEPGIYVTVKDSSGNLAALFDFAGGPLGNPVVSDSNGAFFYYVENAGTYIEEFRLSPTALPRRVQAVSIGLSDIARVTPELYGAVGYPLSLDDAPALHAMGVAISLLGRGVVDFYPGRTYIVGGGQVLSAGHQGAGYAFPPIYGYVIDINGCTGPVVINGNGAIIKCAASVKYGSFLDNGTPQTPTYPGGGLATPYYAMIRINDCSGSVSISGFELDGNIANATIGGEYQGGRQIAYTGLTLTDNTGGIIVEAIHSHHHGEDGGGGNGLGDPDSFENVSIRNCWFHNNGRQGFSLTAGIGWEFDSCRFNGTGKDLGATMTYSAPGAGVDLEPEAGRHVHDILFRNCEFVDNAGPGCLAPEDASANGGRYRFENCKFVGTTSWSHWLNHPYIELHNCVQVGAATRSHPDADPARAIKFYSCLFTDDPALSPTGVVNNAGTVATWFDYGFGVTNISYDRCTFQRTSTATGGGAIAGGFPNNSNAYIYMHNCSFLKENATGHGMLAYGVFSGTETYFKNVSTMPATINPYGLTDGGLALDSYIWEDDGTVTGSAKARARYPGSADPRTLLRKLSGTAAPTTGPWLQGEQIIHSNPASGGFIGRICTAAGTPGTWKTYGVIS